MDSQRTDATLDDVRLAIFRQHTQLAQLLDELETDATAVLVGDSEGKSLGEALELLRGRFVRHLEYEEAHLAKWLEATGAGEGSLGDHGDQRSRMNGLVHDSQVFADPRTLAHAVLAFVHHLRKDLAAEDATLRALR